MVCYHCHQSLNQSGLAAAWVSEHQESKYVMFIIVQVFFLFDLLLHGFDKVLQKLAVPSSSGFGWSAIKFWWKICSKCLDLLYKWILQISTRIRKHSCYSRNQNIFMQTQKQCQYCFWCQCCCVSCRVRVDFCHCSRYLFLGLAADAPCCVGWKQTVASDLDLAR